MRIPIYTLFKYELLASLVAETNWPQFDGIDKMNGRWDYLKTIIFHLNNSCVHQRQEDPQENQEEVLRELIRLD